MLPIPTSERHGRFGAGLRGGRILLAAGLLVASLGACTNMSQTQQRTLSGGAIGAAGGADGAAAARRDRRGQSAAAPTVSVISSPACGLCGLLSSVLSSGKKTSVGFWTAW